MSLARLSPEDFGQNLQAAQRGDAAAFSKISEPHRRELTTHCYRMLGSLQDAEDMVQETFLRAWRRLDTYEGRASFRAWLYRIASNACLDALKRRPRRSLPAEVCSPADLSRAMPAPDLEPVWIEPYPDEFLATAEASPETRYETLESISLAFMVALQVLPPRQRCILILVDVLDWPSAEIAGMLEISLPAVNSLLQRARATMKERYAGNWHAARAGMPAGSDLQRQLERYMRAWEMADVDLIVDMLKEDATFPMPPMPFWLRGREAIGGFIRAAILPSGAIGLWKLAPVRANGFPAFAFYRLDETRQVYLPYALQLLAFDGPQLSDVTTFGFAHLFRHFGLPEEIAR